MSFFISELVLQVSCRELKRADHVAIPLKGSKTKDEENERVVAAGLFYSIEIKDAYIPPWIICNICATMGSEGRSFEARYEPFVTMPDYFLIVKGMIFILNPNPTSLNF